MVIPKIPLAKLVIPKTPVSTFITVWNWSISCEYVSNGNNHLLVLWTFQMLKLFLPTNNKELVELYVVKYTSQKLIILSLDIVKGNLIFISNFMTIDQQYAFNYRHFRVAAAAFIIFLASSWVTTGIISAHYQYKVRWEK